MKKKVERAIATLMARYTWKDYYGDKKEGCDSSKIVCCILIKIRI